MQKNYTLLCEMHHSRIEQKKMRTRNCYMLLGRYKKKTSFITSIASSHCELQALNLIYSSFGNFHNKKKNMQKSCNLLYILPYFKQVHELLA